jgi:AbrB family looped-hinge helix DNA binding protein
MKSTVSSKGQITLPVDVRERLGLAPGTAVHFELREDGVLVRKGGPGVHPVDQLFGRLRLAKSVDALLDEMRGPRPKGEGLRRRAPAARR